MSLVETLKKRWWIVAGGAVVVPATAALLSVMIAAQNAANEANVGENAPLLPTHEQIMRGEGDDEIRAPTTNTVNIESTETMPYHAVWNPPDEGEMFWQIVDEANGYPEDGGTDYVIAHSCTSGDCAGDPVRKLAMGDTFTYRGVLFVVLTTIEAEQDAISGMDIWQHQPDRLVLITCPLGDESGDLDSNFVVIAQPAA